MTYELAIIIAILLNVAAIMVVSDEDRGSAYKSRVAKTPDEDPREHND